MAVAIPEKLADLLTYDKKAFANLALTLRDSTPQVTPVWFDYDGEHIIVNSARGRVKDRVLSRKPAVAMAISDPADPYRYVQIRGRVVDVTEDGARDMIDHLSEKYLGKPYPFYQGETRVTFRIVPVHISAME